ncbi:type IV pilus biogenesis protein PilP [Herbaspirillum sp. GCM10030257]|uniref:type IV pilus biogenesis protein PilP n=1 Tax=Herbaspirillum sp. GCM10030257 TaxID=3273393 RepID=UPI003607BB15
MQNKIGLFIVFSGIVLSGSAVAESASDTLTRVEAETLILKAREKQLDVQASIVAKQNDIAAKQAYKDQMTQNAVAGDPVIRSIEGIGKSTYATLELSNGNLVDAQVGDVLSNGMRIVSIRSNEVIVERQKKRTRLFSSGRTPTAFNPSYPSSGLNLPPLPMMPPGGIPR